MKLSMEKNELKRYIGKQMDHFFPDGSITKYYAGTDIDRAFNLSIDRVENCFKHISNTAYCDDWGQTYFSHTHADQYAQLLYFYMNSLWKESENKIICDKMLVLNRMLHSIFISYKCAMPDIFILGHPVGTILGNAQYSDYLYISQNVTVNTGSSTNGATPKLGKGLFLAAGAKIIGEEEIGDRVSIGVDAVVYKKKIESDKLVIRDESGKIVIKDNVKCIQQSLFRTEIR